jgi:hypothetical protein
MNIMNQDTLTKTSSQRRSTFSALAGLLLVLAGAGCGSLSGPGSASFASVTIKNHSAQEIAAACSQVFGADGYRGGVSGPGQMVFEKEASRATSFSREGLVETYYGAQTINRVRVEIVALSDGSFRLQCKAFMVSGGSDPFFQDEVPLANIRSGPYKLLLNKVSKQLK